MYRPRSAARGLLGKRVDRKGRLDPREALAVAVYVARALDYAWKRARIIHRDIKPDNIFLSREGEVKVGDLGLAKVLGAQAASATQTGLSMGSPFYVSPEQAVGNREIDFRADIYSLGCTLFHMLTGTTPYEGDSAMGVMLQHLTQPPPEIQTIWLACPPAIVGLLDRMLRKDAGARHQSYEELLEDLTWVSEKIEEQPEAPASPAISMIVPTPRAIATAPVAMGKAVAKSATVVAVEKGKGLLYGVIAGVVVLAVVAFVWAPWKKPASHAADITIPIAKDKVPESTIAERPTPEAEPEKTVASAPAPDAPQAGTQAPSTTPTESAWIELFNGRDFTGWRGGDTFNHRVLLAMSPTERAAQITKVDHSPV